MRGVMLALMLLAATRASAQEPALGRISFPTSGAPAAQPHFIRGVLLLHSFEYDDAAEAFRQARAIDPGFAMAYWGEAMTANHPLWRYQDLEAGRRVLNELAPTPKGRLDKAATPREQAWLETLETLYGEGDKPARDTAYEAAMARLSARFPDDDEARAFHALSILGTNVERRDLSVDVRAAALVEDVFLHNPEHPGALHYMIHAYDSPMHAPLGLRAAQRYGRIAAGAAHAVHMTSHIFLALGMWDETIAANEASWAASATRVARKHLDAGENGFHAYLWLAYAYLQQGRVDDARRVVDQTGVLMRQAPSGRGASHYAMARAAWIVNSRRWDKLPDAGDAAKTPAASRAAELFAEGLAAVRLGRVEVAEQRLTSIAALRPAGGEGHHGSADLSAADREGLTVTAQQLTALIALARGERERGLALLADAARAEDAMPYESGPPFPVKPTRELLGEALLEAGQPREAATEFRAVLARTPGRALALEGLAEAQRRESSPSAATR
jgi:tetratricopeptide (TPR) repeat protein